MIDSLDTCGGRNKATRDQSSAQVSAAPQTPDALTVNRRVEPPLVETP
jgi:hypothetical protein